MEVGTSIVMAHVTNKALDPKAYDSDDYFDRHRGDLEKDYIGACEFLEVFPTQEMESIKVKVGHRFLGLWPENFIKDSQEVKDFNNEKFLLVRAKYRIIVDYRD